MIHGPPPCIWHPRKRYDALFELIGQEVQTVIKPGDVLNTRDLGELHLDSALDRSQRLFLGTMGGRGALGCLNTHTGRGEAVHNIHGSSNKTHTLYVLKHVYMYYLYF